MGATCMWVLLCDAYGKDHLDFAAGIAVNALDEAAAACGLPPMCEKTRWVGVLLLH